MKRGGEDTGERMVREGEERREERGAERSRGGERRGAGGQWTDSGNDC